MALDLYVGTLTRYYSGDWENVAARAAREQGAPIPAGDANGNPGAPPNLSVVHAAVLDWRRRVQEGMSSSAALQLTWDESAELDYCTDRPLLEGYASLLLLALHTAVPGHELPTRAVQDPTIDPLWGSSVENNFEECEFQQIVIPEFWLPVDFDFIFTAPAPSGKESAFGSSYELLRNLEEVARIAYDLTPAAIGREPLVSPEAHSTFREAALFGLTVFTSLARKSVLRGLPMLLDY